VPVEGIYLGWKASPTLSATVTDPILWYGIDLTRALVQWYLRQFRVREDVNLLLNTKEMADLVKSVDVAASSFYKFLPKLGLLRHLYLDFDDLHALVFPLPDRNTLFVGLEKMEQDIPNMTRYIIRLLQQNELTYDYG
jgi:hypothetical protein